MVDFYAPYTDYQAPLSGRFRGGVGPGLIALPNNLDHPIPNRAGAVCGGARSKPKTCKLLSKSNSNQCQNPCCRKLAWTFSGSADKSGSAIMYTGFFENCSQVIVDGAYTDVQLFGYAQAGKALV